MPAMSRSLRSERRFATICAANPEASSMIFSRRVGQPFTKAALDGVLFPFVMVFRGRRAILGFDSLTTDRH
jgi:hypothetical protein